MEFFFPSKLLSPNTPMHWAKRYRYNKSLKHAVALYIHPYLDQLKLPLTITFTRQDRRPLDDMDNLPYAFKTIRDQVAYMLFPGTKMGQMDNSPLITWQYAQKTGKQGFIIKFEERKLPLELHAEENAGS